MIEAGDICGLTGGDFVEGKQLLHERMEIGILLALAGGFLDAYTYITCGGVFANAQTGNIVLMGINVAKGNFAKAGYYFIPVLAFFLGVMLTEHFRERFGTELHWEKRMVLLIETLLLFVIAWLPGWVPVMPINVTISFICSLQVNSFRKVAGVPYASTMCTGNLRYIAEHFYRYAVGKDRSAGEKSLRYFLIVLSFCIGAGGGTFLISLWGRKAGFVCCGIFLAVLIRMYIGLAAERKAVKSNTK